MSLHEAPLRPRPEDRCRGDGERPPLAPCGLRSEAFAEDLADPPPPAAARVVPLPWRRLGLWPRGAIGGRLRTAGTIGA